MDRTGKLAYRAFAWLVFGSGTVLALHGVSVVLMPWARDVVTGSLMLACGLTMLREPKPKAARPRFDPAEDNRP